MKVSVIVPVYNVEDYLEECIQSIRNQTLKDIEIICVDDGSTDRSYDILTKLQKKDDRIVVLKQKNKFAGVARNKGIEIARGEYLVFLDSDDFFEETLLCMKHVFMHKQIFVFVMQIIMIIRQRNILIQVITGEQQCLRTFLFREKN